MKNATTYRKKIKDIVKRGPKAKAVAPPEAEDRIALAVGAVLRADATDKEAEQALRALDEEFVDYNELRVAMPREILECIGKDFPAGRRKAGLISDVLNAIYRKGSRMSLDFLDEVPKKEIHRRLSELGLDAFSASYVALFGYGVPAVPVDDTLAGCLEMNDDVAPGSSFEEIDAFVNRAVPQRDAAAAYAAFREYAQKNVKDLSRKRQAEAKARAEAEEAARKEAEAAEAEAKAKAEAAAAKKAAAKKTRKKASAGKTDKKTRKAKKSAKSAKSGKNAKKTARKSGRGGKTAAKKAKKAGKSTKSKKE